MRGENKVVIDMLPGFVGVNEISEKRQSSEEENYLNFITVGGVSIHSQKTAKETRINRIRE